MHFLIGTNRLQVSHHVENDEVVQRVEKGRDGPFQGSYEGSAGGITQLSAWPSLWGRRQEETISLLLHYTHKKKPLRLRVLKRLPRTMTLTDITTQKISFKASASRLTDAGRKSYVFSAKWSSIEEDSQQYIIKQCIDSLCIFPLKVRVACVIYVTETQNNI